MVSNTEQPEIRAALFRALGDETRMRILDILRTQNGTLNVGDICERLGNSDQPAKQPTVSHHIKVLEEWGLLDCHPEGTYRHYFIDHRVMRAAQKALEPFAQTVIPEG